MIVFRLKKCPPTESWRVHLGGGEERQWYDCLCVRLPRDKKPHAFTGHVTLVWFVSFHTVCIIPMPAVHPGLFTTAEWTRFHEAFYKSKEKIGKWLMYWSNFSRYTGVQWLDNVPPNFSCFEFFQRLINPTDSMQVAAYQHKDSGFAPFLFLPALTDQGVIIFHIKCMSEVFDSLSRD